jgi:hypothetical protein
MRPRRRDADLTGELAVLALGLVFALVALMFN